MRTRLRTAISAARVLIATFVAVSWLSVARGEKLDDRMHHLRSGKEVEWEEFAAQPEGAELRIGFQAKANAAERALRLRHRDLKQQWTIRLNDREIAKLPQD